MSDLDNKILKKINERIHKFESDLKDRQYPDTKQKLKGGIDELQQLKKWIEANGPTTSKEPSLNIDLVSKRFCLCKEPDENWDSGQTCFCGKCDKLVNAC